MLLMRRLFGREELGKAKADEKARSVSNVSIRTRAGIYTIESTLRQRRLLWFRQIIMDRHRHEQYLASLFGKFGGKKRMSFMMVSLTPTRLTHLNRSITICALLIQGFGDSLRGGREICELTTHVMRECFVMTHMLRERHLHIPILRRYMGMKDL